MGDKAGSMWVHRFPDTPVPTGPGAGPQEEVRRESNGEDDSRGDSADKRSPPPSIGGLRGPQKWLNPPQF